MAIYSRPVSVDAFKGSVGGVTFQKAGPSSSVRMRRAPRNIRTVGTSKSRNVFTHVRSNYRTLSSGEKSGWDSESANYPRTNSLGEVYTVSGTDLFTRLNKPLVSAGIAFNPVASSPVSFPSFTLNGLEMSTEISVVLFDFASGNVVPANFAYIIRLSAQLTASPSSLEGVTLFQSSIFFEGTDMNSTDTGTGWFEKFGIDTPVIGNVLVGRVDIMSTLSGEIEIGTPLVGDIIFS